MRHFSAKLLIVILLLVTASLGRAAGADTPRLLVSHREMPGAWRATEVSSPLTVGPDGRIYFVTASPWASARFGCFDPQTQQFEQLSDLGAQVRVTAPVVFDRRGTAWLATAAYPNAAGGQSARILPYSLKERTVGAPIELEGYSIIDLGIDAKRGQLLMLAAQSLKGQFFRYDLKRKQWKTYDLVFVAGVSRMIVLNDGSAVILNSNDIYLFNPKKDRLEKIGISLPAMPRTGYPGSFFGASALVLGSNGKTVYGIARATDQLFAFNPQKKELLVAGPAFGTPAAHEQRMALAAGVDGKVYYAGFEKNQGLVGVFDPRAGKIAPPAVMSSPAKVLAPMLSGSACLGKDKRIYVAGFGGPGCGLYAFPPFPEKEPWSTTGRSYDCRRIPADAVTLDGRLEEPIWGQLTPLEGFVTAGPDPQPARSATTAYVAWSATHLYLAFRCATDGFQTAGTERDDDIWTAECAELFVCPLGADSSYYEIDANPEGVIYDSRVQSYSYLDMTKHYKEWAKSWDGMEAKTHVEHDADGKVIGWTLEAAVPFTAFDGGAPRVGDAWLFNAFRIAMTPAGEGEWTTWHSTHADFHKPHQFPKLKFVK
jgi:hypothetical protein